MAKRILTALVGIPLAALVIRQGGAFFLAAVVVLALVALYELNNMAQKKGAGAYFALPPILAACLAAYFHPEILLLPVFVLGALFILLWGIFAHKTPNCLDKVFFSLLAFCYIGFFFSQLVLLRNFKPDTLVNTWWGDMPLGEAVLWLALIGTWASDSFAYFVGVAFGRHKLCPALSPKKSWEGAAGGFVGCLLGVWLAGTQVFLLGNKGEVPPTGWHSTFYSEADIICLGLLVAIFAPLGDLAESQLKRFCAVKDSGGFFPGHGGVLDRFDSLLFVAPVVYVYLYLTVGMSI